MVAVVVEVVMCVVCRRDTTLTNELRLNSVSADDNDYLQVIYTHTHTHTHTHTICSCKITINITARRYCSAVYTTVMCLCVTSSIVSKWLYQG